MDNNRGDDLLENEGRERCRISSCVGISCISNVMTHLSVLPNSMLSFTLLEEKLRPIGYIRFAPAILAGVGTQLSIYSLLSPHVQKNLNTLIEFLRNVNLNLHSLSLNRYSFYANTVRFVILLLAFNAAFIFMGLKLEGVNAFSQTLDFLSNKNELLRALSIIFSSPLLVWPLVLVSFPNTMMAYSNVHKIFLIDKPKNFIKSVNKYIRNDELVEYRIGLKKLLKNIIITLKDCSPEESLFFYRSVTSLNTTEPYSQKIISLLYILQDNNYCYSITHLEASRSLSVFIRNTINFICNISLFLFIFSGTYSMSGAGETSIISLGFNNNNYIYLMSIFLRLSISLLWYLNIKPVVNGLLACFLKHDNNPTIESNYKLVLIGFISFLSGLSSSLSNTHSFFIACQLNNFREFSLLGFFYLASSITGPTIADGYPVFRNKLKKTLDTFNEMDNVNQNEVDKFHKITVINAINDYIGNLLLIDRNQIIDVKNHIDTQTEDNQLNNSNTHITNHGIFGNRRGDVSLQEVDRHNEYHSPS